MTSPSPEQHKAAAHLAGKIADSLKLIGPAGFGVAMAVIIDVAKHFGMTRDRFLRATTKAWDTWKDE